VTPDPIDLLDHAALLDAIANARIATSES